MKKIKKIISETEEINALNQKTKAIYSRINTHITFFSNKLIGTTLFGTGLSEFYSPELLSVVVKEPLIMQRFRVFQSA